MERQPNNSEGDQSGINRRRVLFGLGAVVAAAAVGTAIYKSLESDESSENLEGEKFAKELSGYSALYQIGPNKNLFVGQDNVPMGVDDFSEAIPDSLKKGSVAISPPPLSWRRKIAGELEADPKNSGRKVARSLNVALDFKAALEKGESQLIEQILSGEADSLLDIVNYYSEKPVRGLSNEISRKEYVRDAFVLSNSVPSVVRDELQAELRLIMPGLCAQESRFNNNLKSDVGARGIFQFMPNVWKSYGKDEDDSNSLKTQTEVAGLLMSDIYRQLMHHCDDEALLRVRDLYPSKSDFLRHFIVPMMVNSYNAGSKRLAVAANEFFTPERNLEGLTGKDVFLTMADFAKESKEGILENYGDDAREYFSRATAFSRLL